MLKFNFNSDKVSQIRRYQLLIITLTTIQVSNYYLLKAPNLILSCYYLYRHASPSLYDPFNSWHLALKGETVSSDNRHQRHRFYRSALANEMKQRCGDRS